MCRFLGIFYNHVNCKEKQFYFSFLICMAFIPFSCLIAVATTSTTMLNKSGERGLPFSQPFMETIRHLPLSIC